MGGDKTRRLTAKEVERLLSKYNFELVSQKRKSSKMAQSIFRQTGHSAFS
jgi:hypothetical protein